jgi:putative NIF3 family GTP cyclohydrolase 1 type 2
MSDLTRREFTAMAVAAAAAPFAVRQPAAPGSSLSVQALIDRIKGQIGVDWRAETVDGLKAGEPTTPVRGIATTSLATLAVLQQAVKAGANVIVTSEPAFYSRTDARTPPASRAPGAPLPTAAAADAPPLADPVFTAKNAFIDRHQLAIVRLNDHWRRRQPDPFVQGLVRTVGWTASPSPTQPPRVDVHATTLDALVTTGRERLGSRGGIRVSGDPKMTVRRVGLLPGSTPLQATVTMLPTVDVIVGGEMREWESVEFVRDAVLADNKKALVLVGRIVSEEPGMNACAAWLKTVVPGIPVTHLAAGDPYWRPAP